MFFLAPILLVSRAATATCHKDLLGDEAGLLDILPEAQLEGKTVVNVEICWDGLKMMKDESQ